MKKRLIFNSLLAFLTITLSACGAASQMSGSDSSNNSFLTPQGMTSLQVQGGEQVTIQNLLWAVADSPTTSSQATIQPSASINNGSTTTHTFSISDSDLGGSSGSGAFQFTVEVAN